MSDNNKNTTIVDKIKYHFYMNPNKITSILDKHGCYDIKEEQGGDLITCGLSNSSNTRSLQIQIDNANLYSNFRTIDLYGDFIDVVSYLIQTGWYDIKTREDLYQFRPTTINWLTKNIDNINNIEVNESDFIDTNEETKGQLIVLDEEILNGYMYKPHSLWYDEGIGFNAHKIFGISYCLLENTINIPMRNIDGLLIGLKCRNLNKDTIKYVYRYGKNPNSNLYGLWITKDYIKEKKKMIIFESEKSVMKSYSYGIPIGVSMSSSSLSRRQIDLINELFKDGGEVIMALDNDMELQHIERITKRINNSIKITYIDDDMLNTEYKDAPVDAGREEFRRLLNKRKTLRV